MKGQSAMQGVDRRVLAALFYVGCLPARPLPSQEPSSVDYELRWGSVIRDECRDCDRIPIERPLEGTFRMAPEGPDGTTYSLLDVDFSDPAGDYKVRGAGTYSLSFEAIPTEELVLDIEVNTTTDVRLSSGVVEVVAPFPTMDLTAGEPGDRDPLHMYAIRVVAAPRVPMVLYKLEKGSTFIDDCTICGRPTIPVPITGSFLLGEVAGAPIPVATYRVDSVDFQSADGTYRIVGAGTYRQGGEVALTQEMRLEIQVNDSRGNMLPSSDPEVSVVFPAISIQLGQLDPPTPLHVYSLDIRAIPSDRPRFLRGDENADGSVDISDAVGTLLWLFLEWDPPSCLDAANSNGDVNYDLNDALYTLNYLFGSGDAPPAPGPRSCGITPAEPPLGCESYPPCAGAVVVPPPLD